MFTNEQAVAIFAAISELTTRAKLTGKISDAELQGAVGDAVDFEQWMLTRCEHYSSPKKQLEDHVLNRRRVVWVNHEVVTHTRREIEAAKIKATEEKQIAAEQGKKVKAEKKREKEEKKRKREEAVAMRQQKKLKSAEAAARKAAARKKKEDNSSRRKGRKVNTPARFAE